MILEFSVKNFLSFKEKVTFSMIANSNKELNDNYVEIGGNKVLKSAAVYGANASGKSNLFKILTLVVLPFPPAPPDCSTDTGLWKAQRPEQNQPARFHFRYGTDPAYCQAMHESALRLPPRRKTPRPHTGRWPP